MSDLSISTPFLNRELSQIEFNRRVLAQAENKETPLLERLKFLCIVSSNFDEFFEVRVAGLKEQIKMDTPGFGPDGMLPRQAFKLVSEKTHRIVSRQYQLLNESILPELARHGIRFLRRSNWGDNQREWIKAFFFRELMPMLTPIGLDHSHPFPRVLNKSLNFAV
ncbi:MAG: RNA degradosome polyphosphate kinase, partial [Nitrosomonas communis]|nr:RNA degradosome polyphosphate kinase [Nitrosomonas communis]